MSDAQPHQFDARLLDLHLGQLSTTEQVQLQRLIDADPELAAQDQALTSVFQTLNSLAEARAPLGLTAKIQARVKAARPPLRVLPGSKTAGRPAEKLAWHGVQLGKLRDLVAVAAIVVLAIGVGAPSLMHMRERQQRLGCSYNLAQLGRGLQQYATTYNAALPFAGFSRAANSWQPTSDPGVVTIPNRRHMYPLLQKAFVADPHLFVCPAQRGVPMPASEIAQHDDFLEGRNCSYAYQNQAGVRPTANDDPRLPVIADENPLFADGRPLLDFGRLLGTDPLTANSRAHGGAGQNILNLLGEVKWLTTPNAGLGGDNIWTLENVTSYTGHEGPSTATDSHLLK